MACIGVPTCQIGIGNSQNLLRGIVKYFRENNYVLDNLPRVYISGCQNSCGVHEIGKIGFFGKKKRVQEEVKDVFGLSIGGDFGIGKTKLGEIKGDLLPDEIPQFLFKLSENMDKSQKDFDTYIKENKEELENLIKEYSV